MRKYWYFVRPPECCTQAKRAKYKHNTRDLPGNDAAAPLEHGDLVDRRFHGPVLSSSLHGPQGVHVVPEAACARTRDFIGLT